MLKLLKGEWFKMFLKWRTYVGFGVISAALTLVFIGLYLSGPESMIDRGVRRLLGDQFIISGNFVNGLFIGRFIMNTMFVHIPLLIAFAAGDLVAGESTAGTFRLYLIRPVTRIKVYISKFAMSFIYSFFIVYFLGGVTLLVGWALFGMGPLISVSGGITIFKMMDGLERYIIAYNLAVIPMWTIATLALFFSVLVKNAIGPIIGTMGVLISFLIISNLDISFFDKVSPYLFTSYLNVWDHAFTPKIPWDEIIKSLLILFGNIALFFSAGAFIFTRKDILT